MEAASFFGASETSAEKDRAYSGKTFRKMPNLIAPKKYYFEGIETRFLQISN
jgi:hypothetical protein